MKFLSNRRDLNTQQIASRSMKRSEIDPPSSIRQVTTLGAGTPTTRPTRAVETAVRKPKANLLDMFSADAWPSSLSDLPAKFGDQQVRATLSTQATGGACLVE